MHRSIARTLKLNIVANFILVIIKFLAGFFGHSYALIADAIESTTDIFSSALLLFGLKYSNKPADSNHPYGHGKIEPFITFIVVAILILSAGIIIYESVLNIINPHKTPEPWTLIILAIIIVWKELSYRIMKIKNKEIKSTAINADAWHQRSDAITSLSAFIGILISVIFGKGYETADDWAALFSAGFILYNSYLIFRPAFAEIMDEQQYDDLISRIRIISESVEQIKGTEKCFVRKHGSKFVIDLHALVNGNLTVKEGHSISHKLKDTLMEKIPEIENVLIHIEPENES